MYTRRELTMWVYGFVMGQSRGEVAGRKQGRMQVRDAWRDFMGAMGEGEE